MDPSLSLSDKKRAVTRGILCDAPALLVRLHSHRYYLSIVKVFGDVSTVRDRPVTAGSARDGRASRQEGGNLVVKVRSVSGYAPVESPAAPA
jgi:hypothetical protein